MRRALLTQWGLVLVLVAELMRLGRWSASVHGRAGLLAAFVCGCGSAAPSPEAGVPDWNAALKGLGAAQGRLYSWVYDAPPADGAFLRFSLHAATADVACGRYAGTSWSAGDYWYLAIDLNDRNPGTHVPTDQNGRQPGTARVELLHRRDGAYVEHYFAVGGYMDVLATSPEGPGDAGNAPVAWRGDLEFPIHALQLGACMGGQAVAVDAAPTESCQCLEMDGGTSSCVPDAASGETNCCHDLASPRVHFVVDATAGYCSPMCRYASGLPDYCQNGVR